MDSSIVSVQSTKSMAPNWSVNNSAFFLTHGGPGHTPNPQDPEDPPPKTRNHRIPVEGAMSMLYQVRAFWQHVGDLPYIKQVVLILFVFKTG